MARLIGLIAFAILIVVLLILWVQSCQEDKQRDAYADYMAEHPARLREASELGGARAQRRADDARESSPPSSRSS